MMRVAIALFIISVNASSTAKGSSLMRSQMETTVSNDGKVLMEPLNSAKVSQHHAFQGQLPEEHPSSFVDMKGDALQGKLPTNALQGKLPTDAFQGKLPADAFQGPLPNEALQGKMPIEIMHEEHPPSLVDTGNDDPCRYWGCNSQKCEWVSGEVVRKVAVKSSCGNARALKPRDSTQTIDTLTQCLRAVKHKVSQEETKGSDVDAAVLVDGPEQCSALFEMDMETSTCSCVPVNSQCTEKSHEKVCRFELVQY
jgi:hypothetical protein